MIGLYCYDVDGEFVWHRDLGGYPMLGDWGTGSSPILHEGLLYLQIDNEESSFLTALDAATGEDRWRADRGRGSSWSTPMIWRNRTRTELVTNGDGVRSYDPDTGELLWSLEYPGGRASASPVGDADMLFVGNERRSDGGGGLFAIRAGASGDITPAPGASTSDGVLWSQTDGGPEFASPLLYQGHLYIFGRSRSSVGCYDAKSGLPVEGLERLPGARPFWSSPWGHGDKVFGTDESGTTFVLGAAPALELLATFDIGEEVRSSPAILGDTIILRGVDHVFCIAE
jgi:outer membrane protein assembly factor BamB